MRFFNKQWLYVLGSFLAGFSVMVVELISSRIVAPIIGSSVFTWTSVIGITLLGLAIGSYIGGQVADKTEGNRSLPLVFLLSSILVSLIPVLSANTDFITDSSDSILKLNLYLSIYLFLLPTLAIGLIQPIILKKYANNFLKIGSEYGILSFAWSSGGILGVFLTGFFFISYLGSRETIWLMSIILFVVGLIFAIKNKEDRRTILFFLITAIIVPTFIFLTQTKKTNPKIVFQKETNYYNAKVVDGVLPAYGNSRILILDTDFHGIQTEKASQYYTEIYPVFESLNKNIKNILAIGAGAYIMPKYFKDYYKGADVSVVEIDPEMVNIGNNFFELKKYDIKTIIGDAKIITNKSKDKYDVIFSDAYNSYISIPWYLLTKEWNEQTKEKLNNGGIYAINLMGSLTGERSELTKSVLETFKISFPNYYVFAFGEEPEDTQNIELIGIKGTLPISENELHKQLSLKNKDFLAKKIIPVTSLKESTSVILTNNFSPVEKLMKPTIESYFPKSLYELKTILSI